MFPTLSYAVVGRDGADLCFAVKNLSLIQKKVFAFFFPTAGYFYSERMNLCPVEK